MTKTSHQIAEDRRHALPPPADDLERAEGVPGREDFAVGYWDADNVLSLFFHTPPAGTLTYMARFHRAPSDNLLNALRDLAMAQVVGQKQEYLDGWNYRLAKMQTFLIREVGDE